MRLGHGSKLVPEGIEARALHPRRHHGDPVTRIEARGAVPKVGRAHVVQGPSFRIWAVLGNLAGATAATQ